MQQIAQRQQFVTDDERLVSLKENPYLLRLLIGGGVLLIALLWLLVLALGFNGTVNSGVVTIFSLSAVVGLLIYSGSFWLVRQRKIVLGSRVLFYGMVISSTLSTALIGGATGPLTPILLVPVVSAGLLGRGRDSILVVISCVIGYLGLLLAENLGYTATAISDGGAASVFVSVAAVLGLLAWLSGRDLSRIAAQSGERAEELMNKTEQLMEKNIQQIELGSELSAAAAELQVASQQQASGATEQASAVSQVSTTIEELGSTARQIAQAAEHVSDAAQQTLENLSSGQDAVDESIQAMERIRGRVQDVSERVLSLGERSQQIGEIIDLIDDISDETHLLALNAAIEAAGAGEHGRRFAVVAAEVKSLANRTLAAAKEVKGVIAEIRQATSAAVLAAEDGSKEVERGVELAHRAGQVMDNIVMVAERTAQAAAEIGLATAQQQSASEQVVETMREIAEVARQSALGARQMADSAATLTAIADRLHGIVITDE
ncbi:MAG: methyl-accepting chemotaxis protein [Oscillochloris sp.]|nr:methyl-accepting chemotaxis protein [Oscillochloris sp.]